MRVVLDDAEECAGVLRDALDAAAVDSLPLAPAGLLDFVRKHVIDRIAVLTGPTLSVAFFADLVGELEQIDEPAPPSSSSPASARLALFLVERDRALRASTARLLLNARYDVTVLDGIDEIVAAAGSTPGPFLAMLDVWVDGAEVTLRALVRANPEARVVAWTAVERIVAASVLEACGIGQFVVVSRSATSNEMVEAVHRLNRGLYSSA